MPIVSVRGNENKRWKRNAKKKKKKETKREKNKGADALVKGWELNDFFVLQLICKLYLIFKLNLEL